jgi:hypothetical protein
MLENTISTGNLLTLAGFVVFITMYVVNVRNASSLIGVRLQSIDSIVGELRMEVKKLQDVTIAQALQDQRVSIMEERELATGKRLDELKRDVDRWIHEVYELRHRDLNHRLVALETGMSQEDK